jgi:small subunit ribosomal protein S15
MARMYSRHKGKHGSKHPPIKKVPKWLKYKKEDVINLVVDLAKQRYSSAMIGTILRDSYGIPDVKVITGKTISQIMKENNLYPSLPEDLMNLLRKAVNVYEHLRKNKKDKNSLRNLQNLESKIRRLVKYYKKVKVLPKDWTYSPEEAKLIVQR